MSSERTIKHVLFDVADTLLYKPALWETIRGVLADAGMTLEITEIARAHRATRELITVPSQTSRDFYVTFNARFLEVLGILPTAELVEQVYRSCRKLHWTPFADTAVIKDLGLPFGIISNWDSTLRDQLKNHFPEFLFSPILVSEELSAAKPDQRIYLEAVLQTRVLPNEILFIGDSVRLDMTPATKAGLTSVLIDRQKLYPFYNGVRIESLTELPKLIQLTP